jgi:hypothetical protein
MVNLCNTPLFVPPPLHLQKINLLRHPSEDVCQLVVADEFLRMTEAEKY